jgi:signal transduction histidine kinase
VRSIRRRLVGWLLPGFLLLWLAGGAAVYVMFRSSEIARIDVELEEAARSVRLGAMADAGEVTAAGRGTRWRRARLPEFDQAGSGAYYMIRDSGGKTLESSPSLEGRVLPPPGTDDGRPVTVRMDDEETVRMVAFRIGQSGPPAARRGRGQRKPEQNIAVVALSLREVRRSLAGLITGLAVAGAAGAGAGVLLIGLALRDGMRPLRRLADEVAAIAPRTLSTRFETVGLPRELAPVVDRLNELLERLDASFERERRFSSDLAHELKTPLAEARSAIELGLRFPEELGPDQQRRILETCLRMERLVASMLRLARRESAGASDAGATLLGPLVSERWSIVEDLGRSRAVSLDLRVEAAAEVTGDLDLWSQIFDNLLGNAATYAAEGSAVRVESRVNGEIEVSNLAPGLREEDLGRMFDRLWRKDEARSDGLHSGLGLSIARACAEGLGKRIDASLDAAGRLTLTISEAQPG